MVKENSNWKYFPKTGRLVEKMEDASSSGNIDVLYTLQQEYDNFVIMEIVDAPKSDVNNVWKELTPLDSRRDVATAPHREALIEKMVKEALGI